MAEQTITLNLPEQASFDPNKQARLSALLKLNKAGQITPEQRREMDDLLAQAYELAAKKARAARILKQDGNGYLQVEAGL